MDMGDTYTKNHDPDEKTPWNPSKSATKRVKDVIPAPTSCPNCQGQVGIKQNSVVYNGRLYGDWPWIYMCLDRQCDSYVGMHPFTNIPLGTLANHETREARKKAKAKFRSLSEGLDLRRDVMYQMLATEMGIKKKDCHFGHFDVKQCAFAEAACFNLKFNLKR